MTAKHFSKKAAPDVRGRAATHWTNENPEFCTAMSGEFPESSIDAAKAHFAGTHYCADDGPTDYMGAEEILSFNPIKVDVYGLCKHGDWYYWNGEKRTIIFRLQVGMEQ